MLPVMETEERESQATDQYTMCAKRFTISRNLFKLDDGLKKNTKLFS